MNRVLIVEDNFFQLEMLKETICERYPDWIVETSLNFENGKMLLEDSVCSGCFYNLFLFDVKLSNVMGDKGGFELAKETRKYSVYYKTPIIFLSGFSEGYFYALSEIHCYNYIEKPIFPEQLLFELEQMSITGYLECDDNDFFELVDTNRIRHKIMINDIYTIEAKNHTLIIHTSNGSVVTREYTLEKILKVLGSDFVQCHRGAIINRKYIDNYDKACQYIQLGEWMIPVGRSYRLHLESVL
ncbi:MAG: response regulator transcription factor [Lachnospiraceae bacterium]|nr:response regulator transcription factor [Lachnospiraceae bacterium]